MVDQRETPAGSDPVEGPEQHREQPSTEYLSTDQKVIHSYAQKKGLSSDVLEALGCTVKNVRIARFNSDGKPVKPWEGPALLRPLFDTAGNHCGYEQILAESICRSPDDKPNDKFATKGAKVAGTFTPIGFDIKDLPRLEGRLIVCAGLADGHPRDEPRAPPDRSRGQ